MDMFSCIVYGYVIMHSLWICYHAPEKRGRKPGSSLNGDRRVESMGGSAAGGWWGHRGRGGGAGGVMLCWVWARGASGEKEGMCRKKERREEVWERSGRMKRA